MTPCPVFSKFTMNENGVRRRIVKGPKELSDVLVGRSEKSADGDSQKVHAE
jgi:hypothetical protein